MSKKNSEQLNNVTEESVASNASFRFLFSTADGFDYFVMVIGTIGGVITGISLPYFNFLFGQMIDNLNTDPGSFNDQIVYLVYQSIGLAIFNIFSGILQVQFYLLLLFLSLPQIYLSDWMLVNGKRATSSTITREGANLARISPRCIMTYRNYYSIVCQ